MGADATVNALNALGREIKAAELAAATAAAQVVQKRAAEIVRYKTGNLSRNIAKPSAIHAEATSEGAEAYIHSGVEYDAIIDAKYGHYEQAANETEGEQHRAAEAAFERELRGYF